MKVKKITAADRKLMVAAVGKLSPKEKDQAIADLILFAQRVIPIIDELTKDSTLSTKEKKEIEDSITVGPQWLKFSRTTRRKK